MNEAEPAGEKRCYSMMQSTQTESSIAFHPQLRANLQTHLLAAARGKGHSGIQGVLPRYGHKWHQPQGPPPPAAGKHGNRKTLLMTSCRRSAGPAEETQRRLV